MVYARDLICIAPSKSFPMTGTDEKLSTASLCFIRSRVDWNKKPCGQESAGLPNYRSEDFAARRAAAAVASLNRWRGMLRRAKRRRCSETVSKSASIKISTVSSLE